MKDCNLKELATPVEKIIDPLTELLRNGARDLIRQAVEAELEEMLSEYSDLKLLNGGNLLFGMVICQNGLYNLQRFLASIAKYDVLIIDDFGMLVMDAEQKRLLLEIFEQRYELRSTIITSQLAVEEWYDYLNEPLIADALLDRIVHQAEKIVLSQTSESMRKLKANSVPAA